MTTETKRATLPALAAFVRRAAPPAAARARAAAAILDTIGVTLAGAAEPAEEADDNAPRFRILVADGDVGTRDLVARTLAPLKVEVLSAADSKAALKLAARETVDIIVADLELARVSGFAALSGLRNRRGRNAATPVLALVHNADDELYDQVMEQGFHGLVAKPFSPSELVSAIAHALAVAGEAA